MRKFYNILVVILALFLTFGLSACKEPEVVQVIDQLPTEIDHLYSNKISFADMNISLGENKFLKNKVAKLKLKSVTDGDTAVFYLDNEMDGYTNALGRSYGYITVRFLAIDTPESTSSIAPWGKKASNYAKEVLSSAEAIIVDATSIDTSNADQYPTLVSTYASGCRLDSNGTRWLGLIWYCPQGKDANDFNNYRLYQLDMIEECYSYYTGNLGETPYVYNADSAVEPLLYGRYESTFGSLKLSDVLLEADIRMQTLKVRHTGYEKDPNYDYSKTPHQATIKEAHENFDEWMNNAKFVELTGVITAFIGNNFYFEDAEGYPLYVYMGINSKNITSLFSVGDTISIRGRLAVYGGQMQLSDVVWAQDTFKKITDPAKMIPMPEAINVTAADFNTDKLDQYMCKLITVTVKGDGLGNQSKDKSYTLYTSNVITGKVDPNYPEISIRINGTLAPGYEYDQVKADYDGKNVVVTGILSTYMEEDLTKEANYPSYQIVLGNRVVNADGSLESDIVLK